MVDVGYRVTLDDFVSAHKAHQQLTMGKWIIPLVRTFVVLTIAASIYVVATAPTPDDRLHEMSTFAMVDGIAVLWVLGFWVGPYLSMRRQFRNQPNAQGDMHLTATDELVRMSGATGQGEAQWTHYVRWTEGRSVFLMYPQPRYFVVIPKSAFSPEQVEEFRRMLGEHVGPVGKLKKA